VVDTVGVSGGVIAEVGIPVGVFVLVAVRLGVALTVGSGGQAAGRGTPQCSKITSE
jgi:hypothetical protein